MNFMRATNIILFWNLSTLMKGSNGWIQLLEEGHSGAQTAFIALQLLTPVMIMMKGSREGVFEKIM